LKKISLLISCVLLLLISACGAKVTATNPPTQQIVIVTPSPTQTNTPNPGKVVFIQPAVFTGDLNTIQTTVSTLAAGSNLQFEVRQAIQPADITSDWKLVILLNQPDNLNDLIAAAPQTRFMVVSSQDLAAGGNLNIIRLQSANLAFLAGYTSELLAEDWRAAGLFTADSPSSNDQIQAFENGGQYWCGICSPAHPPYVLFPLTAAVPSTSDWTAWQATFDQLVANRLAIIFIPSQAASAELLILLQRGS
jgi:basic membrane lipoprotein Med (substrate-binding protein (PBP1-ABC) superfamily)